MNRLIVLVIAVLLLEPLALMSPAFAGIIKVTDQTYHVNSVLVLGYDWTNSIHFDETSSQPVGDPWGGAYAGGTIGSKSIFLEAWTSCAGGNWQVGGSYSTAMLWFQPKGISFIDISANASATGISSYGYVYLTDQTTGTLIFGLWDQGLGPGMINHLDARFPVMPTHTYLLGAESSQFRDAGNGNVMLSAVPEPCTMLLLLFGLAGLIAFKLIRGCLHTS